MILKELSRNVFHCSVINVRLFLYCHFLTAQTFYHVVFCLSRTFLTFFEVVFQLLLTSVRCNFDRIPHHFLDVNSFLHFFQIVFFCWCPLEHSSIRISLAFYFVNRVFYFLQYFLFLRYFLLFAIFWNEYNMVSESPVAEEKAPPALWIKPIYFNIFSITMQPKAAVLSGYLSKNRQNSMILDKIKGNLVLPHSL